MKRERGRERGRESERGRERDRKGKKRREKKREPRAQFYDFFPPRLAAFMVLVREIVHSKRILKIYKL